MPRSTKPRKSVRTTRAPRLTATHHKNTKLSRNKSIASGILALSLAGVITLISVFSGLPMAPFGIIALASTLYGGLFMLMRHSAAPGVAALPLVLLAVGAGFISSSNGWL